MRAAALPVLLAALVACSSTAGYERDDLLEGLKAIRSAGAVGAQALVSVDGRQSAAVIGVADSVSGAPVPVNGHYRIASNTKPFVATVVLQLVAEGRVALDDSVERHLPGIVRGRGNDGRKITVRDLLRHTSGLYGYDLDPNWNPFATYERFKERRLRHYEPEELVAIAMRHAPLFEPGTMHKYANTNYVLAGMLIRAVTGRRWQEEVRARIIEPLGLGETSTGEGAQLPHPHAKGYSRFTMDGPLVDTTVLDPSAGDAGGSIISTPKDFTRFFGALLGGELLPPAELAAMQQTVPAENGRYGLGLAWGDLSCGGGYWRHGGAVPGYLSYEGFLGDGRRGVVLSVSSMALDGVSDLAQGRASDDLIDKVLCEIRA